MKNLRRGRGQRKRSPKEEETNEQNEKTQAARRTKDNKIRKTKRQSQKNGPDKEAKANRSSRTGMKDLDCAASIVPDRPSCCHSKSLKIRGQRGRGYKLTKLKKIER
jgi:hypothetical protein